MIIITAVVLNWISNWPHVAEHHRQLLPCLCTSMSVGSARTLFLFFLVINCILWSRGRYGQPIETRSFRGDGSSLVKRISYELTLSQESRIQFKEDHEHEVRPLPSDSHPSLIPFLNKVSTLGLSNKLSMQTCRRRLSILRHLTIDRLPPQILLC